MFGQIPTTTSNPNPDPTEGISAARRADIFPLVDHGSDRIGSDRIDERRVVGRGRFSEQAVWNKHLMRQFGSFQLRYSRGILNRSRGIPPWILLPPYDGVDGFEHHHEKLAARFRKSWTYGMRNWRCREGPSHCDCRIRLAHESPYSTRSLLGPVVQETPVC